MRCRMSACSPTMGAPRQDMSSVSGRRCSRCSLIVRRFQGLLSSKPGDALRAPSGIWRQPILRAPSLQQKDQYVISIPEYLCRARTRTIPLSWYFPRSSGRSLVLVDQAVDDLPARDPVGLGNRIRGNSGQPPDTRTLKIKLGHAVLGHRPLTQTRSVTSNFRRSGTMAAQPPVNPLIRILARHRAFACSERFRDWRVR